MVQGSRKNFEFRISNFEFWNVSRFTLYGHKRGFTLLELMIVIAILGITLGYVAPRIQGSLFASSMDEATRGISAMIRYSRSLAIKEHKYYFLRFDISDSRIGIYPRPETTGEQPLMLKQKRLPEGVEFSGIKSVYQSKKEQGEMDLTITPQGIVEQGVIYLEDPYGNAFTLVIKPFSGNLKVYDHYVEIAYE
jgi:general secretion pathway protein H